MAPEAWPEGLGHAQFLRSSPVHMFLCNQLPAPLGEGAAALTCLQLEATAVGGAETVISPGGGTFSGGFQVFGQTQFPASLLCYVLDRGLCYEEQCFI